MIEVRNISFRYERTEILRDVSLSIAAGEHVAIVGPSGAGKSTLLHIIAGLLTPRSGEVRIAGASAIASTRKPVLMFQRPALLPWLTARDNILLPSHFSGRRSLAGRDKASRDTTSRDKADGLLRQVGLAERAGALPFQLSGGQQQRVALARALMAESPVLLLDEPFSALDLETRSALRADIRRLARSRGITLVTVTHDLSDAAALASRVLVLAAAPGRIARDITLGGNPEHDLRTYFAEQRQAA